MSGLAAVVALVTLAQPQFEDVSDAVGMDTYHALSPYAWGAGAAWFDWDDDGWLDLFVAQTESPSVLMRNTGPPGYTFEDVSDAAGLGSVVYDSCCVLAHDFTGDGKVDLVLMDTQGGDSLVLLAGKASGPFDNQTHTRIGGARTRYVSFSAADFDGDGDLDIVALRYPSAAPIRPGDCLSPDLYENDRGVFRLLADAFPGNLGCSLAAAFTDLDGDGDLDYFQINDFGPLVRPAEVHLNEGPGADGAWAFSSDVAASFGLDLAVFGMGLAVGDVDRDLQRDFFATSIGEDILLLGDALGTWTDATDEWRAGSILGLAKRRYKWGTVLLDADNDGWEDLLVTAGGPGEGWNLTKGLQRSILLRNPGGAPFVEHSTPGGLGLTSMDRSFGAADYDRDGRMDVVACALNKTTLMRNVSPDPGHWVGIRPLGTVSNRAGLGVVALVSCGEETWRRELLSGGGFGGNHAAQLHVGLGDCPGPVSAQLHWPTGWVQTVDSLPLDEWTTVTEPAWLTLSATSAPADATSTITVTYHHDGDAPAVVGWTSTLGVQDAPTLAAQEGGVYVGVLTAPALSGEALIGLSVNGAPLPVHRRISFGAPETGLRWVHSPARPHFGLPLTVGVRFETPPSEPPEIVVLAGGKLAPGTLLMGATSASATVDPDLGATSIEVVSTVGGAQVGPAVVIPLVPKVSGSQTRLQAFPAYPETLDDPVKLLLSLEDGAGDPSPTSILTAVDLKRDGVPVEGVSFEVSEWGEPGQVAAYTTLAELGGAGTFSATVNGAPVGQVATITLAGDVDLAAAASPAQSQFRFFDRHLHADGEDLVPIVFALTDDDRQSLPKLEAAQLGFVASGLEVLPDTLYVFDWSDVWHYVVFARVGTETGMASVALTVDGTDTGLAATAALVPPAPYAPAPGMTVLSVTTGDPPAFATGAPADGTTELVLRILPRDASANLVGAGQGISVTSDGGTVGDVEYVGFGHSLVTITAPTIPCTATVEVSFTTTDDVPTRTLTFTAPDGAVVETPCAEALAPVPDPGPEPDVAEPEPDISEPPPEVVESEVEVVEPVPDVPEPAPDVPEPAPDVPEPAPDVAEPAPDVPEPAPDVPEPAPDVAEPAPDVVEPAPDVPEPQPEVVPVEPAPVAPEAPVVASDPSPSVDVAEPEPLAPTPSDGGCQASGRLPVGGLGLALMLLLLLLLAAKPTAEDSDG